MKKIVSVFIGLLLAVSISAQIGNNRVPVGVVSTVTNDVVASGGTPTVLDDGSTEMWWIAHADYITTSDGDSVDTWTDKTTNAIVLEESAGKLRPVFSGDSVYYETGSDGVTGLFTEIAQPFTWYAVINLHEYVSRQYFFSAGSTVFFRNDAQITDSTELQISAGTTFEGEYDMIIGEWAIVRLQYYSTSSEIQINDGSIMVGDAGTNGFSTFDISPNDETGFSVKEIIVRSADDSVVDEESIINYLNNKYSIY